MSFYEKYEKSEIVIDRDEEDRDVETYQQTKDLLLLEKIYKNRIPTLRYWAIKHYFPGLAPSIDDFYAELIIVFCKALEKYKKKKGAFNTCLYTFLLNRIKNIKSSKHAKKRKPKNYDGPISGILLSLDHCYDDGDGNGDSSSLMDKLENEDSNDYEQSMNNIYFNEAVDILGGDNQFLKDVFIKLGNGVTLTAILKECKTKTGEMSLPVSAVQQLKARRNKAMVKTYIKDNNNLTDFVLVSYDIVNDNRITYTIELKKTDEADLLLKTIRKLRRNKYGLISLLRGKKNSESDKVFENHV